MHSIRILAALFSIVTFITLAVWFAPAGVGGATTYAITNGTSMSPGFTTGDLVLLRRAGPVKVGDIAGYESKLTGQVVIHRVISINNGLLTFKGDHNSWTDTYRPTQQEVIGKLWLHASGAGAWTGKLRSPWALYAIGGVIAVTLVNPGSSSSGPARRRQRRGKAGSKAFAFAGSTAQLALGVLLVGALGFGTLAFFAFRSAESTTVQTPVAVHESVVFSYQGKTLPGPVYLNEELHTGDPIFVDLVPSISTTIAFKLTAPNAEGLHGTIRLFAVTRDVNGWEQSYDLVPDASFVGTTAESTAYIDLPPLMALAAAVQEATGVGTRYWTSAITADIHVEGTIDGQAFSDNYQPFFTLRVNPPNEIFVETSATRSFESHPPAGGSAAPDPFHQTQDVAVAVPTARPLTMGLFVGSFPVDGVRLVASVLAILAFVGAMVVGSLMAVALRTPSARFYARFGNKMVRATGMEQSAHHVEMRTMEDLARVAERYQSIIVWVHEPEQDTYAVQDASTSYVYRAPHAVEA